MKHTRCESPAWNGEPDSQCKAIATEEQVLGDEVIKMCEAHYEDWNGLF
jgi:hypothetical protein